MDGRKVIILVACAEALVMILALLGILAWWVYVRPSS